MHLVLAIGLVVFVAFIAMLFVYGQVTDGTRARMPADSYDEGVIEANEQVVVFAQVVWDPVPGAQDGYREGSVNRVRLVPPETAKDFLVSNLRKLIGTQSSGVR